MLPINVSFNIVPDVATENPIFNPNKPNLIENISVLLR